MSMQPNGFQTSKEQTAWFAIRSSTSSEGSITADLVGAWCAPSAPQRSTMWLGTKIKRWECVINVQLYAKRETRSLRHRRSSYLLTTMHNRHALSLSGPHIIRVHPRNQMPKTWVEFPSRLRSPSFSFFQWECIIMLESIEWKSSINHAAHLDR